jgi:hypothetical protein
MIHGLYIVGIVAAPALKVGSSRSIGCMYSCSCSLELKLPVQKKKKKRVFGRAIQVRQHHGDTEK